MECNSCKIKGFVQRSGGYGRGVPLLAVRRLQQRKLSDYLFAGDYGALGRGVRWLAAEYVQGTAERVAGVQGGSRRKDTWKR